MDRKPAVQCRGNADIEAALVRNLRRNVFSCAAVKIRINLRTKLPDQFVRAFCTIRDLLLDPEHAPIEESLMLVDLHRADILSVP